METYYTVNRGREDAGKVVMTRQGLYFRFQCRCYLPETAVYQLVVRWENGQEDLGVLVPLGDGFGLDTRRPAKIFTDAGPLRFEIVPRQEKMSEHFVPIYPDEPFSYLAQLKHTYLVRKNGMMGILVK